MSDNDTRLTVDRRDLLRGTGAGALGLVAFPGVSAADRKGTPGVPPDSTVGIETSVDRTTTGDDPVALIIRDCLPWEAPGNEIALSALNIPYEVMAMETAVAEFSGDPAALNTYEAVILPSTQDDAYYADMSDLQSALDAFVTDGGCLVAHIPRQGWPCNSTVPIPIDVDGNYAVFDDERNGGDTIPELQQLTITDPDHPITDSFDDAALSEWSGTITSFGHIESLPTGTNALVALADDPEEKPCMVEYSKGDGSVIATMQVMEWPFNETQDRGGTEAFLEAELAYAIDRDSSVKTAEIEATRTSLNRLETVTVQVQNPVDDRFEYDWRVVDRPDGSTPGLLHGDNFSETRDGVNEATETKRHAVLRPDLPGEYVLAVEIRDEDAKPIANGTIEFNVEKQPLEMAVDNYEYAANLAEAYAPRYVFHPEEQFYPTRYEAYVENSEVRVDTTNSKRSVITQPSLFDLGNADLAEDYQLDDDSNEIFLLGNENDFKSYQAEYPQTINASVTPTTFEGTEYIAVTYWTFYLFDPKKEGDSVTDVDDDLKSFLFPHASDTETVTILFDESGPKWVAAAQHYDGEYMRWEKVQDSADNNRLTIYPAKGSHASFLINTDGYPGGIPGQFRWVDGLPQLTTTFGGAFSDETASGESWSYNGGSFNDDPYQLVMLSDSPAWTEFAGQFASDPGRVWAERGTLPQQQADRWSDPGQWFPERMLPEPTVLENELVSVEFSHFSTDNAVDTPSAFRVRDFDNPGVKPHQFNVEALINPSQGESTFKTFTEPLGWSESTRIDVDLDDVDIPDSGDLTVTLWIRTYSSEVADDSEDLVYSVSKTVPLSWSNAILSVVDSLFDGTNDNEMNSGPTVTPGESVDTSLALTNTGDEVENYVVTMSAQTSAGEVYDDGAVAEQDVSLDAGESEEVSLSWTIPPSAPEGTYNIAVEAWLATDSGELDLQLDEQIDEGAFTIEKPTGTLEVSSTPAASVLLDGEPLGKSPVSISLPIGDHDISVVKEDFEPATRSIVIEDGETTAVDVDLESTAQRTIQDYTNEAGIVDTGGLLAAINDWQVGTIEAPLLVEVIEGWQSGEPVV